MRVEPGDARGVEPAETGIGRRHEPAVGKPDTDVPRGTVGETAVVERLANRGDLFAKRVFLHSKSLRASNKNNIPSP